MSSTPESEHDSDSYRENSIVTPAKYRPGERPSRAQAQIYGQIARGLTDVLMEYGLIGSAELPADPRVAATFQDIFPRELMQPPNINSVLEQGR